MPKEYSTKFKTEVIKRYQNGESILALSQELRIAQSTIYHWRKEFCSIKAAILQMCRCRKSCPF